MFRWAIIFIFLTTTYVGADAIYAQDIAYKKLFEKEDGLSERSILDIHRDQAGRFWLFYNSGIQRYDGAEFQSIRIPPEIQLNGLKKTTNLSSNELAIEFNDRKQLLLFNPSLKIFKSYPFSSDEVHQRMFFIDEQKLYRLSVRRDSIFIADRIGGDGFEKQKFIGSFASVNEVIDVKIIGALTFLLLKSNQLIQCDKQMCKAIAEEVLEIAGKVNGELWVRKKDNTIWSVDSTGVTRRLFEQCNRIVIRTDKFNNTLVALANNQFATEKLMLYHPDGGSKPFDEILTIDHAILSFYADDFDSQLLLATHHGLWLFKFGSAIKNYLVDTTEHQGYGNIIRSPFYRNVDSSIYFVKEQVGLYRIVDNTVDTILPNRRYPNVFTRNMKVRYDSLTDRLYGIRHDLSKQSWLNTYDFKAKEHNEIPIPFAPYEIKTMGSELWLVGSENDTLGVFYRLDAKTKKVIYRQEFDHRVVDFLILDNQMYLATSNGLLVYKITSENEFELDTKINLLVGENLNCLKMHNNNVLVGTRGNGLYVLSENTILHHVSMDQGMLNNTIASMQIGADQNIWLATFYGLTALDSAYNFIKNITTFDGLPDDEFNTLASFAGDDGQLYFGTINGLATFYPASLLKVTESFSLVIDEVLYIKDITKTSMPVLDDRPIQLPYGVDTFHVNYHVYDYIVNQSHDNLVSQIELTSTQTSDQLFSQINHISAYTQKVGRRTINISRKNSFGGTVSHLASIEIETQNFISKFKYLIISSLMTLALLLFLLKMQRQRRVEQEKFKEAQYKAELSRFQLQALQAQMNPHFIFNALGSIQYFIHQNEAEIADGFLSDFASLMRLTLESSKSDMISLRDELKLLRLYVKLEHLRFEEFFTYQFDVDEELEDDFNLPPMMLQPFIENAINHGFPTLKDRKGHLLISVVSIDDDTLKCVIQDNGVGRQSSLENTTKKHKSRGMEIVGERIESLRLSDSMQVSIDIEDLVEAEKALGTKVTVVFSY